MFVSLGLSTHLVEQLEYGEKVFEGRTVNPQTRDAQQGDFFVFNCNRPFRIKHIGEGATFADLLNAHNYSFAVSSASSIDEALAAYERIYPIEKQQSKGVCLFELEYVGKANSNLYDVFSQTTVGKTVISSSPKVTDIRQVLSTTLDAMFEANDELETLTQSPSAAQREFRPDYVTIDCLYDYYLSQDMSSFDFTEAVKEINIRYSEALGTIDPEGKGKEDASRVVGLSDKAHDNIKTAPLHTLEHYLEEMKGQLQKLHPNKAADVFQAMYASVLSLHEANCYRALLNAEFYPDQMSKERLLY
jgi:ASC-1-like (ASCH) protein